MTIRSDTSGDAQTLPEQRTATTLTVSISRRTIMIVVAVVIGFWALMHLRESITVLFAAIVIASAIDRPVSWLERHRLPRPFGVLTCFSLLAALLAGVVLLMIPLVTTEISTLQGELPAYARDIESALARVAPTSGTSSPITVSSLFSTLGAHLDTIAVELTQVSIRAGHALVLLLVTFVCAYYLSVAPGNPLRAVERFVPVEQRPRVTFVADVVRARIGGWAAGQAMVAATFGVGMGAGLWLLGVPYAVSLGIIAALLELVPYVGGIVTILLATPLALQAGPPHALAVLALYAVLVNIEAHIIAPYFLGRAAKLPSFVVLLALLAGAEVAGIVGILLAVPMTVVLWALVDALWPASESHAPERDQQSR